jgi:hypothetical membrane protein
MMNQANTSTTMPPTITSTTASPGGRLQIARGLALGAIVGPVLFAIAWIVLGVLQPATKTDYGVMGGISGAISNPISGLGVGPHAQLFNAAFVFCGLALLVGVIGAFQIIMVSARPAVRRASTALMAISPVGLAMAGVYTLQSSVALHTVAAGLLFCAPVVAFLVTGLFLLRIPRHRRLGTVLLVASPLTLVLVVLYGSTFDVAAIAAGLGIAGLTERVLLVEIHAIYVALGFSALRRS